ncbi:hypothetical protein CBM2637_U10038 [Cupriavidus taiwanensis]|nr:hypothetical protein CBM2637_U10038 [Cupriavidus taiwanensis]
MLGGCWAVRPGRRGSVAGAGALQGSIGQRCGFGQPAAAWRGLARGVGFTMSVSGCFFLFGAVYEAVDTQ